MPTFSPKPWRTTPTSASSPTTVLPEPGHAADGGFGNLIALPLQGGPRESGNSLFLDDEFEPHADQWAFLASLRRLSLAEATAIVDEAGQQGRVVGLRLPLEEQEEEPWTAPPSGRRPVPAISGLLSERIEAVLGDQLYVPRAGLPPSLVNRLVRLAAFQNPEFLPCTGDATLHLGIPPHRRLR